MREVLSPDAGPEGEAMSITEDDRYRFVGTVKDSNGTEFNLGSDGTDVIVSGLGLCTLRFGGTERDHFMQAFAAAEIDAERAEAALTAETEDS
jgi:hypothetical protein